MAEYACCYEGCGHRICFAPEVDQRLRKTHEWWMCPVGHRQHFSAETDEERRIKELEREVDRLRTRERWLSEQNYDLKRGLHACRWVGCEYEGRSDSTWDFRDLWAHMRAAHGMPTLGAVRSQEAETA